MKWDDKAHFWGNYSTQYALWKLKHTTTLLSSVAAYNNIIQKLSLREFICKIIPSKLGRGESGKF